MKRGPRVHFSFRSPYSWMAINRLEKELGDPHRVLEFVPFWDPDPVTGSGLEARGGAFHYVQMSKAKHLYILQDTKRQAARLGLAMRWPIDVDPWWELPHLAFLRARELGAGAEFYTAVIGARWERGEDVCTPEAIERLARECGLPPGELVGAPADQRIRAAGVECLYRAYEDDIFGIPYFRVGRHRFWGLDRVDAFLAELARDHVPAGAARPSALAETQAETPGEAYDTDTAGGCG